MTAWRVAYDASPDDPNPHPWDLSPVGFETPEEAEEFATAEQEDLRAEYGDEYIADWFRWLVVRDTRIEPTEVIGT